MTKYASLFLGTALSVLGFAGPVSAGPVTCESIDGVEVAADEPDLSTNGAETYATHCRIRSGDPFTGNATGLAVVQPFGNLSIRLSGTGTNDGQGGDSGGSGSDDASGPDRAPPFIYKSNRPAFVPNGLSLANDLSLPGGPSGTGGPNDGSSNPDGENPGDFSDQPISLQQVAVPEPGAVALLGLGGMLAALSLRSRRRLPR